MRILWTWDFWVAPEPGHDCFVESYTRLIQWMAGAGYNGLILWGFLDSRHGGIPAAREVAACGAKLGVRVMPGIGAGGYHGFSISPGMPYNLDDLLAKRPDLRAEPRIGGGPNPNAACLYHPDFVEWLRQGTAWLAENFEIGGVNIETNEMVWIDNCEKAAQATRAEPNRLKYAASFSDLAIAVPVIHQELKSRIPDAWTTYATYEPAWWHRQEDAHILGGIPAEAIAQWNMEMDVSPGASPPVPHNISLIHSGGFSCESYAFPPLWGFTQYRCFRPEVRLAKRFMDNQRSLGVEGFVLGAAGPATMPDNEINYLACTSFADNPDQSVDAFLDERLPELYGPKAAPSVKRLMLGQPEVQALCDLNWKRIAEVVFWGKYWSPIVPNPDKSVPALEGQIALAEEAIASASPEGVSRLQKVLDILREYLAISQLCGDPALQSIPYIEGKPDVSPEVRQMVTGMLLEAGLPSDVYLPPPHAQFEC